jgi:hypothetical protein
MDENGDRKSSQLAYSAVGDSRDWSSLGSGAVEINDDPYPGVAMLGIGGRLALFKGGIDGGAVYIATPTGVSSAPIRIDAINPETSIGPVVPRSVIPLSSTTAFFLGHDAAYIYDGVRALLPFAEGVARDITSRLNPAAIDTGFAIYKRATREVELHVATGVATTPNEIWIFDTRQRRAYGPYTYADSMLCATTWQEQGALSWDTWGQAAGRTWDTLTDAGGTEYHQWDLAKGDTGSDLTIYGGADGQLYQNNTTFTDDDGTAIACTYLCPPVTPMDWTSARGGSPQQGSRRWRPDDIMVLREVHIRHRSTTQWTPVVEVSTDGSAFSAVSDGTAVAATGGRLLTKSYYVDSSLSAPGTWHQARVKNTSGDELAVRDITLVFTYAGGGRHE